MKNELQKTLYLYAIYNNETSIFDALLTGFSDRDAIDYYVNSFKVILKKLKKKNPDEYGKLIYGLQNSSIYRVGFFDFITGEFSNDKIMLVNKIINESEENLLNEKK